MKLNNKGMSIIEIIVTFTLIMAMVIGMLTIVMNYRDKASVSLKKLEMDTFKNTLTKDIQDDISSLGVNEINTGGECANIQGLNKCINIVFKDGTEKILGTSYVNSTDINSVENKYVYYDGDKYKLKDILPDSIPEGRNILDLQTIIVDDSEILKINTTTSNGSDVNIYTINIGVSHIDFEENFGIRFVVSNNNLNTETGNNSSSDNTPFLLANSILNSNKLITSLPNLTTSSNNTYDVTGLYKSTLTNSGSPTYYFRGKTKKNYVKFADIIWRIIRINEDGTIRLITENSINNGTKYAFNSNSDNYEYMYYSNSEVKPILEEWYQFNIVDTGYSNNVVNGEYFCEQVKVTRDSSFTAEKANMEIYSSYVPNFKCSNDNNEKGIVTSSVGLINYDEIVHAGGYYAKANSNYYLYITGYRFDLDYRYYLTMSSPGCYNGSPSIWAVGDSALTTIYVTSSSYRLRPVINLRSDVMATGSGLIDDPYVIQ